jgi:hypothetical protein
VLYKYKYMYPEVDIACTNHLNTMYMPRPIDVKEESNQVGEENLYSKAGYVPYTPPLRNVPEGTPAAKDRE